MAAFNAPPPYTYLYKDVNRLASFFEHEKTAD
jgi:hypothetical protein